MSHSPSKISKIPYIIQLFVNIHDQHYHQHQLQYHHYNLQPVAAKVIAIYTRILSVTISDSLTAFVLANYLWSFTSGA